MNDRIFTKEVKELKRGSLIVLALLLLASMAAIGCAKSAPAPAPAPASAPEAKGWPFVVTKETPRIAYLLPNVGPWYNDKWAAVQDESAKLGWEAVMFNAGGYDNVAKQVAQVEDAVTAGYDGIIIHVTNGAALIPPVMKALEAGVNVSTEHSGLAEPIVPHIWEDPEEAGHVLGYLLANMIGGEGEIFMLNGPPGQLESLAEEEAMTWVFDTFFPGIKYTGEWPTPDNPSALKATEDYLTAHPNAKGIYVWGGSVQSTGVNKAVKAAGYKPGELKIVASYSIPSGHDLVKEGWVQYVMPGAAVTVGRTSVQNMARMFKGETVPLEVNVPMVLLGQGNIDNWDQTGWYWRF